MKPEDNVVPKVNSEVIEKQDKDVLLLFHPGLGKLFELNMTAKKLWKLCDGTTTVGDIKREFHELYGDVEHIDKDVVMCLEQLLRNELIVIANEGS